ncbi:putative urea ABC transporter substrate-binding protein [Thalassospira australica]|uniref:putative urea ABC transporter substrate-binding protein n=1 Tax=Thalassospira australica TaxID=1528106 RepID=UPI00384F7EA3
MLKTFFKTLSIAALFSASLSSLPAHAEEKSDFKVCWSIYVGWMPWGYLQDSGIMKKWADKYDISVDIVQINDYVESINQYTAGEYDGCSMTNMDALSIPAGGGVDTTALIVGDYSNGNDGIILKDATDLAAIKGQNVNLVELSVSHYLLARALEKVGLSEQDVTVVNTSDADMIATYATDDVTSVVTWNPLLSEIAANDNATLVFDSAGIPGEIIDIMMVNTETLADNPAFGKALVGAWYELMGIMASDTDEGIAARTAMAEASGTDLAGYDAQLASTAMFFTPDKAVEFTKSAELPETMKFVAEFLFDKGILGEGAPSPEFVGVSFPDGSIYGDSANVKLKFDTTYMEMAAKGEL